MKSYVISIVITSIIIAISELILPQGRLKSVSSTVFSLVMLICIITPLNKSNQNENLFDIINNDNFSQVEATYVNEYFNDRIENYYEKVYSDLLLQNDLVTEKIIVEIDNLNVNKIEIFLSNLVIPEENSHIDNNVIANYVAQILNVEVEKVKIYA